VLALTSLIKEITKSHSLLVFKPLPQDDPKQRRPDISRAKELFSREPKVSVREGLMRTVNYFFHQAGMNCAALPHF
jgi:nucleoside-diphosphate-sugar epimerase